MKCLCATMRRASRLLTGYYEKELHQAGLTPAQFELLAVLSQRPRLFQSELAEALGVDQTTLSRNMKVLIGRDCIKSAGSSSDKRQVLYSLSGSGKKVFQDAVPHWQRAQKHMHRVLGGDWKTIWSGIERLTGATAAIDVT